MLFEERDQRIAIVRRRASNEPIEFSSANVVSDAQRAPPACGQHNQPRVTVPGLVRRPRLPADGTDGSGLFADAHDGTSGRYTTNAVPDCTGDHVRCRRVHSPPYLPSGRAAMSGYRRCDPQRVHIFFFNYVSNFTDRAFE